MIHVCIFSSHEGDLRAVAVKKLYLTIFGACTLHCLTLARQILAYRREKAGNEPGRSRPSFLTVFGGVDIVVPTLAEEFIDLREVLDGGALTMTEWERALADLDRFDVSYSSLTLFGGFTECKLPSENEEVEGLARHRHLGNISANAGGVLQLGIGQVHVKSGHGAQITLGIFF